MEVGGGCAVTGWSTRPDLAAGAYPRADQLEAIEDQVSALTGSGWTDYTTVAPSGGSAFALTAVTTAPTQGNSTYLARYRRAPGSDLVLCEGYILVGSTFAAGNGVYRFGVPFNASASAILCACGPAWILDNGTAYRTGIVRFEAAGYVNWYLNASSAAITNTGSGTAWATGDIIAWSLAYEPA